MAGGAETGAAFAKGAVAPEASLAAAAAALDRGDVSAAELTFAVHRRIKRLNPKLGAFTDVLFMKSIVEAGRADMRRREGKAASAIAGVPVAVKDLIDTTPAVCSAGLPFLADYHPQRDAKVVRQLRRAGAVVVGVTATDPGAFGVRTPATRHPQAPERTVGGSSGGSGAALAAGLAYAALGTDTGGSIRIPAACCAVAGLKPTRGRVSLEGVRPLVWSLDHVGPMARTAADLGLVQTVLDRRFLSTGSPVVGRPPRVGHDPSYYEDAAPVVKAGIARALEACAATGCETVEVTLPDPDSVTEIHTIIFCAESAAYYTAEFPEFWDQYPPVVRQLVGFSKNHTGADYVAASRTRAAFTRRTEALFKEVDFVIVPTLPVLAPPRLAETVPLGCRKVDFTFAMVRYTCLFDHTGHPVVALPVDVVGPGLAVSAQIVGPLNRDRAVVEFAQRLEAELALDLDRTVHPQHGAEPIPQGARGKT